MVVFWGMQDVVRGLENNFRGQASYFQMLECSLSAKISNGWAKTMQDAAVLGYV